EPVDRPFAADEGGRLEVADEGVVLDAHLPILDLEREARQPLEDGAVERALVLGGDVALEARGVPVAEVGKELRRRLDEIHEVTVSLLRLLARRAVVRAFSGFAIVQKARVVAHEEVELARDGVVEATAEHDPSSL